MAITEITSSIESLTGATANSTFIENAQRFIVQSVPKNLLKFAQDVSAASTDGSAISYTSNDSIIEVQRNGYSCKEIPFSMSQQAGDSTSLFSATAKRPVYWQQSDGVKIAPDTAVSAGAGYVHYIEYSKIDDDTDLRNAVVFHASASEFTKLATTGVPIWDDITVPTAPASPNFGNSLSITSTPPARVVLSSNDIDTSNWVVPTYNKPVFTSPIIGEVGAITLPSVPVISELSTSSVDFTEPSPTYTKPVLSLTPTPSITDLTISGSQPVAPTIPSFSIGSISIGSSSPTYIKPSFAAPSLGAVGSLNLPAMPISPQSPSFTYNNASVNDAIATSISVGEMDALTATAPNFTMPIMSLTSFPSLTWSVGSPPTPPVLTTKTIASSSGVEPTYVSPTLVIPPKPSITSLTISATPPSIPVLSASTSVNPVVAPVYTPPVMSTPDWNDTNNWITTEEDEEMLRARVSEINAKIQDYTANLQRAGAEFAALNGEFQKDIQIAIENTQLESAEDSRRLQLYATEVQIYQQDIAKEVQEYQQNFATDFQLWQSERQTDIQKYQQETADAVNAFNKENTIYQISVQEKIKQADLENANDSNLLQKYSAELTEYQAEINRVVNSNTAECNCWQQENVLNLQKYNAEIQANTSKFNEQNVVYQEDIARKTQNFKTKYEEAVENAKTVMLVDKGNLDKNTQIELQNAVNNFQNDVQEYNSELQKYNTDVNAYQTQTESAIQKWLNEEWNQNFQKYQLDYSSLLQEYGTNVQNNLNSFNQEQAVYQFELQEKIEESRNLQTSEAQETTMKLQKFASELQSYQADIGKQVQEYTINEIQKEMAIWNTNIQSELQKYASDIQSELNVFQEESASYQAELQVSLKNADLSDASDSKKIQKYQAELGAYQQEVAAIIQKWTQEEWTQNFQKYQTDYGSGLQQYATDIQNELNFFQKENASYQVEVQKSFKESDISGAEESKAVSKYTAELNEYQQNVTNEVQSYVNSLNKIVQEYQSEVALHTAEIQKYQSQSGDQAQKNTMKTQNVAYYSKEADRCYQMAVAEIQRYISNNEKIIQSTMAAQAAQQ